MKKLQRRMIAAVFLSFLAVFTILLGLVNISLRVHYRQQASAMIDLIKDNNGAIPDKSEFDNSSYAAVDFDEESPYRTRYFFVNYNGDGEISDGDFDHVAAANKSKSASLMKNVLSSSSDEGYMDGYYFENLTGQHLGNNNGSNDTATDNPDTSGGVIIFLDCSRELDFCKTVTVMTAMILVILCGLVTFIFALISRRIIKPFEDNSRKQKQFITDASHELKTPLSIISANADVLRYKDGENVWLDNITSQTKRMDLLIRDLLALTKADEVSDEFTKEEIDLTAMLHDVKSKFEEPARCKGVSMQEELPADMKLRGNREMLERLFSVLTENAVKYVNENGEIKFSLKKSRKTALISIYNSAKMEEDLDCSHLFDRFYRPDSSRNSQTGGYGIGLSIAKKITENHGGKITARREKAGICFEVRLPK